jgi:hypothetical protein
MALTPLPPFDFTKRANGHGGGQPRAKIGTGAGPGQGPQEKRAQDEIIGPYLEAIGDGATLDGKEFKPLEWFVEGMLPAGLALLVSPPKIGKGYIALDLALAIARGLPAFHNVVTTQCDTLYLALEDNERRLQYRMRRILAGSRAPANFRYAFRWPAGPAALDALNKYLDGNPLCRFVIIDVLAKVRGDLEGRRTAYAQDYADIGAFHELATEREILLLLNHHTRKEGSDDVFNRINGTAAIMGAADTVWMLDGKRNELAATLSIAGRDIENGGNFALSREAGVSVWKIEGPAEAFHQAKLQDRVSGFLHEQQEPVTPTEIAAALGIRGGIVRPILSRLKKAGTVEQPEYGKWKARPRQD